jgi:hypothetical protein
VLREEDVVSELQSRGDFVVRVDATREALERGRFDATLAANQIVFEPSAAAETDDSKASRDRLAVGKTMEGFEDAGDMQIVLVEAPPEQIAGALSDLTSQHREFPAVFAVAPGRDLQESFGNFLQSQNAAAPSAATKLGFGPQRPADAQAGRGGNRFHMAEPEALPERQRGRSEAPSDARDKARGVTKDGLGKMGLDGAEKEFAKQPAAAPSAEAEGRKAGVAPAPTDEGKPSGFAQRIPAPVRRMALQRLALETPKQQVEAAMGRGAAERPGLQRAVRLYFVIRAVEAGPAANSVKAKGAPAPK